MNNFFYWVLLIAICLYSPKSEASVMAGVGLFFMVLVISGLVLFALLSIIFFRKKIAMYIVLGIDFIYIVELFLALSHDWTRIDDLKIMEIMYLQGLVLALITFIQYFRYSRFNEKVSDKE